MKVGEADAPVTVALLAENLKQSVAAPPVSEPWTFRAAHPCTIGVLAPCYGASHVIYGLATPHFAHRTLRTLPLHRLERNGTVLRYTPLVLDVSVPLVHAWNAIPFNRDFIVSFELELPRYLGSVSDRQLKRGLRMLASRRCKGILALSDFARAHAARRFVRLGFPNLIEKLEVFRGAIDDPLDGGSLPADARLPLVDRPFSALLMGTQLFHKGAVPVVRAFEALRAAGYDVRLTLVGSFETTSHAYKDAIPDGAEWVSRVSALPWIRFEGPVPRERALAEVAAHDLCLYPSFDESLGWLVVEASMMGKPVLANRVCALPELVEHGRTGWLVDLPRDEDGRWEGMVNDQVGHGARVARAEALIEEGVISCVETLLTDPSQLRRWGTAGRDKALTAYGMADASRRLEAIYDVALGLG